MQSNTQLSIDTTFLLSVYASGGPDQREIWFYDDQALHEPNQDMGL